jgi:hypothetical protein
MEKVFLTFNKLVNTGNKFHASVSIVHTSTEKLWVTFELALSSIKRLNMRDLKDFKGSIWTA